MLICNLSSVHFSMNSTLDLKTSNTNQQHIFNVSADTATLNFLLKQFSSVTFCNLFKNR